MSVTSDEAILVATAAAETPTTGGAAISAVSWGAIIAGAVAASAATIVLLTLGSGLGLAAAAPFGRTPSMAAFGSMIAIWLVLTEWIASALGGYVTGRLRTRWHGTNPHEVFFRDTVHGFLAWAVAAIVAAVVFGPALASATANSADAVAAANADPDAVRKAASAFSIVSALAMAIGAFIASITAALAGHERDQHP
ncbi:MAG TPA: hypothetical protein VKT30_12480 [Caulobacteraceae bacterium]|nr:hypothetical protein [Caulobacteraceae bacterium]